MRDFNFFEIEDKQSEGKKLNNSLLYILTGVAALSLIAYPLTNTMKIKGLQRDINSLKEAIQSMELREKISIIDGKKQQLDAYRLKLDIMQQIGSELDSIDNINDGLIDTIISKMPQEVFFSSLSLNSNSITIQGGAKERAYIALLENNLKNTQGIAEVFIPNISQNEDIYNFSMTLTVKDVNGQ